MQRRLAGGQCLPELPRQGGENVSLLGREPDAVRPVAPSLDASTHQSCHRRP